MYISLSLFLTLCPSRLRLSRTAFVWQMMHFHSLNTFRDASATKTAREEDLVRWANDTVRAAGKTASIESFRDKSIRTGAWWLGRSWVGLLLVCLIQFFDASS